MSTRIALFCAMACVLGCSPAKPTPSTTNVPVVPITPPSAPACSTAKAKAGDDTVVRVELLGNKRTPTKAICNYLRTRAGETFDEARIAGDIRALFDSGLMEDVMVSSQIADEGRTVTFTMRERPVVKEWIVKATDYAPSVDRLKEIFGKSGDVFNPTSLRRGTAKLREDYVAAGYRSVAIDFVVTPAPENQVVVSLDVKAGPKQLITSLRFTGTKQVKESELVALIDTEGGKYNTTGGVYRVETFERALLEISAHYYDLGMVAVKVAEPELTDSADMKALSITVAIEEGPVFKIGKLSCVGDLAATEKECLALLGVKKGEVFSRAALVAGIQRIREFQTLKGHGTDVAPESDIDLKANVVNLKMTIAR